MENFSLKNYAHIGDAVWEVFVRNYVIRKTQNSKMLHKMTTDRVNAAFQKDMLNLISESLTAEENDMVRRARNLSIPVARRSIQHNYRLATAFEVLIGYWYINDKERLEYYYNVFNNTEFFKY